MWFEKMPMHFKDASRSMQTAIQLRVESKYRGLFRKYSDARGLYAHIFSILTKKEYRRMRRLGKRIAERANNFKQIYYDNTTF